MKQICPICGVDKLSTYEESLLAKYLPTELPNVLICEECGFFTSSLLTFDYEYITAKIILDLKQKDDVLKQYWYPIMLDLYKISAIYPTITDTGVNWNVAKYLPIPMPHRILYPIDKSKNLYQEYILDFENSKIFNKFNEAYTEFINIVKKYE